MVDYDAVVELIEYGGIAYFDNYAEVMEYVGNDVQLMEHGVVVGCYAEIQLVELYDVHYIVVVQLVKHGNVVVDGCCADVQLVEHEKVVAKVGYGSDVKYS